MKHKKTAILGLSLAVALFLAALLIVSNCLLSPRQIPEAVLLSYDTMTALQQMAREKQHHDNGRFINPFQIRKRNTCDLLRWKLASPNKYKGQLKKQQVIPVRVDWRAIQKHQGLSITFVKHAWVLIKDKDRIFMVDPILGKPVVFVKDYSPLGFDPEQIPAPDAVLITHGHYDHFSVPALCRFAKTATFITPLGFTDLVGDLDPVPADHISLDWFDATDFHGSKITFLPCNHWTMRNPIKGPNHRLWGAYLFESHTGPKVFISGDSAWFDGYEALGQAYDIDLAIFNLGAYEPRWFMKQSHMNPEEAVRAFLALKARRLMVVHWGAFQLGDEPVFLPPVDLKQELEKQGLLDAWVDIKPGETLFF